MIKPILMIHEIRDWMFELPLDQYILTFDDGLFSQYSALEKFKLIDTEKIFFISTKIICPENQIQSTDFPSCSEAHRKFFKYGDASHYMKWSQVEEIKNTPNCFIGGHSHEHRRYDDKDIKTIFEELKSDTKEMMDTFKLKNILINHFCFPYNKKYFLYEKIIKDFGITNLYGDERIAIEDLR